MKLCVRKLVFEIGFCFMCMQLLPSQQIGNFHNIFASLNNDKISDQYFSSDNSYLKQTLSTDSSGLHALGVAKPLSL